MAERRMFSKKIIDSDAFLDMPLSTQALYFHLSMRADDEGFIGNPKRIRAMIGASDDDMKLLILKRFILVFDSGVVVIKHWRIHNYINPDRFVPTTYCEEKSSLSFDEKKAYTEATEDAVLQNVLQNGDKMNTQVSIGKVSIDQVSINNRESSVSDDTAPQSKRFVKPTVEEIVAYCEERHNNVDAQRFYDFYESNGWLIGHNPMKDWRACVRRWEKSSDAEKKQHGSSAPATCYIGGVDMERRQYSDDEINALFTSLDGESD